MAEIIIVDDNAAFSDYLYEALCEDYFVRYCLDSRIVEGGKGYPINLSVIREPDYLLCTGCIMVLGENSVYKPVGGLADLHIVADSPDTRQMQSLAQCAFPVITCGISSMDTISYTSITDDYLTVSLNRNITALSGREIQPLELPVRRKADMKIYSTLALTAVKLLLDDFDSELGRLY